MLSQIFQGSWGPVLAPTYSETERLHAYLDRSLEEPALALLLEERDGPLDLEETDAVGRRPVHIAAAKGFGAVVNELLRLKADYEARDASHRTPLLLASMAGHRDVTLMLLESGADFMARDSNGHDVISIAGSIELREEIASFVASQHFGASRVPAPALPSTVEVARPLSPSPSSHGTPAHAVLESTPSPVEARPRKRLGAITAIFSPVSGVTLTGKPQEPPDVDVAQSVIKACVDTSQCFTSPTDRWKRVYNTFKAVKSLKTEKQVTSLRQRLQADPSLILARSTGGEARDGSTLLHAAAAWGNTLATQVLLAASPEGGALLWAVDLQGRTALHVAAEQCDKPGHIDIARYLMEAMTKDGHLPAGAAAPADLAGFTPSAWNAREGGTKSKITAEELSQRSELKKLLFSAGDVSIVPYTEPELRSGGSTVLVFGIGEAPGWRVLMEDSRFAFAPVRPAVHFIPFLSTTLEIQRQTCSISMICRFDTVLVVVVVHCYRQIHDCLGAGGQRWSLWSIWSF